MQKITRKYVFNPLKIRNKNKAFETEFFLQLPPLNIMRGRGSNGR
jgi:hypothetical protein